MKRKLTDVLTLAILLAASLIFPMTTQAVGDPLECSTSCIMYQAPETGEWIVYCLCP